MKHRVLQVLVLLLLAPCAAAEPPAPVPHNQLQPPGPPLSPAEALAKMTVPDGFRVELVACEPDIVNPVAMTFDERGRVWITESLEYPRQSAGPGQDRVKVLEDTDGDGRMDRFTVFADGLNIPSGIAVGAGGVWVANAPDILFLQDTDGDGRADRREVVVTGFGRDDTHELPNSLTWGPDGWLYGLNGVFNRSRVEQHGRRFEFTAAMFRIHPRTREFQLFAEGTSNPWGIAWDDHGSAFVSACVIDHLWHITQSGYYHRQAGAYPPFTWKIESIVRHRHQQAAYCGLHYFDSDAYPEAYRRKLYMGNIHGNCINCDELSRDGATYAGHPRDDFLSAHDAWFMPVAQKTGPDGCLYVLDWYDRYHCYQDARRDSAGIDRLKGRLYRIRYGDAPRPAACNLAEESDDRLIERLHGPNDYARDVAQRLLWERADPAARAKLERVVLDGAAPRHARLRALSALAGGGPLSAEFHRRLLALDEPTLRAWGVRTAGNMGQVDELVRRAVEQLATDPAPDVRLQVAIAAPRIAGLDPLPVLLAVQGASADDPLIPHIVWQNLHPLLDRAAEPFVAAVARASDETAAGVDVLVPRSIERLLAARPFAPRLVARLLAAVAAEPRRSAAAQQSLAVLAAKIQTGELTGDHLAELRTALEPTMTRLLALASDDPLYLEAALLATSWHDTAGLGAVRSVFAATTADDALRLRALDALIAARDSLLLATIDHLLGSRQSSLELRRAALAALARLDDPAVAEVVVARYAQMEPELRPQAIVLLTGRASWSHKLLTAIEARAIKASAVNANQVRRLLAFDDEELRRRATAIWGAVRADRDPRREVVIAQVKRFLRRTPGDPLAGRAVFDRVCGQCHKLHGQGQDVGPDITVNGRGTFEQLLSNVLDPSLVIGAAYQARIVVTDDGRIATGLLVEDSPERVVLKLQGGKLETVPRDQIVEIEASKLSLMPEDLEKQLQPRELADLFALLVLDKPPDDPAARQLPGVAEPLVRETTDPDRFGELVGEVAPGFSVEASGAGGVALVKEHFGRADVLRTHPLKPGQPCVLRATVDIPADGARLRLAVSHHPQGDWRLVVTGDGEPLFRGDVEASNAQDGWREIEVDLTKFAGRPLRLELKNEANDWENEFGYWGAVEVVGK